MTNRSNPHLDAIRLLRNFVNEYSRDQSEEALDLLYGALEDPVLLSDEDRKERIMDFLESIEEVVPAIYELNLKGTTPNFN